MNGSGVLLEVVMRSNPASNETSTCLSFVSFSSD